MWPLFLAAAVAGSGFLAKRLFSVGDCKDRCVPEQIGRNEHAKEKTLDVKEAEESVDLLKPQASLLSPIVDQFSEISDFTSTQREKAMIGDEGIFRFSSFVSTDGDGCSLGSKKKKKKKKTELRGIVDVDSKRGTGFGKSERKLGSMEVGKMAIVEEQRKQRKKFCICLKRRKTCKSAFGKCGSCSSQGSSCSNLGLSIALMYMVSTGKAEIDKLSAAVDETTEVIKDLRSKISKRKLSNELPEISCKNAESRCTEDTVQKDKQRLPNKLTLVGVNSLDSKSLRLQVTDDVEYASSVLTEEQVPELLEIEQLEADLESELQKISRCTSEEPSAFDGKRLNLSKLDQEYGEDATFSFAGTAPEIHKQVGADETPSKFHGVSPSELDTKLCHLLIEQQESKILDLETRLRSAHSKLYHKEEQLQSLKDCVRNISEFSLQTPSDEETEEKAQNAAQEGNSCADLSTSTRSLVDNFNKGVHSIQKVVTGRKKAVEFGQQENMRKLLVGNLG